MAEENTILKLTRRALDSFDDPGNTLTAVVRQAHRIAVRRHDYAGQAWLLLQLTDLTPGSKTPELLEVRRQLEALLGQEEGSSEYQKQMRRYITSRKNPGSDKFDAVCVEQLEASLAQTELSYASCGTPPPGLTPTATYYVAQGNENMRATLLPLLGEQRAILSRVRQGIHTYLTSAEAELEAGRAESGFFDQVQSHINGLLSTYAPEAAQNFVAAQDRIAGGGAEDISHALTSCRRMIKSLADSLYPATGEKIRGLDNVERTMSDEQYKNRLVQYVREQIGKHKNGALLQAALADLGSRLTALDALASKGVHANPSIDEARTCVAQTYLLAGDLLNIAEETSHPLENESESVTAQSL